MADAVISLVIERIGDLLVQKFVFLKDVRRQVRSLGPELERMRCFLKDADQTQIKGERIRNWVSEIRTAAYEAEDVIEIFASKVEFFTKDKGLVTKWVHYPSQIVSLNKIGKQIVTLRGRLKEISESREMFAIENLGEGMATHGEELQRLRRSSAIIEDKGTVGFEKITEVLVAELLKEDIDRRVVSIIGMGGVGKTTLAKIVYKHAKVEERFNYRAWVCVSSSYEYEETLRAIIRQLNEPITNELLEKLERTREPGLEEWLHKDLQGKCYLVVLDDVWKEAAWDCLDKAFPDGGTSSRLLLTSRDRDVAQHADGKSVPYELKTLGQEDSWQLFLRKALGYGANAECPRHLEKVGGEIARRCAGLPLAIKVVGEQLLGKRNLTEWEEVLYNFSTYLSRSQSGVLAVLELSYADLPNDLKYCFLYLGLFPEDSLISVHKLIHVWIAEGIIQKRDAENLEETATRNLVKLHRRNMVQVAEVTIDDRLKSCRVHNSLRELAIRKAEDENFLQIHSIGDHERAAKSRYLAVHTLPQDSMDLGSSTPYLRSLFIFNVHGHVREASLSFKNFRKLRILDLENDFIDSLPEEIGEVRLLRYLGLRGALIGRLPYSLGFLRNLLTLDIFKKLCEVQVSNFIWKLESLRHLYAYDIRCNVPLKIAGLRNLQTLSGIHFDDIMQNNMTALTSLRKLGIVVDFNSDIAKLCTHLAKVGSLKTLHLYSIEGKGLWLPPLAGLSKLAHVTELKLSGMVKTLLPDFPPNLSRLSLRSTRLDVDPLPILEKLGQLSFLKMKFAYEGKHLVISGNGFPQLKFLELSHLHRLTNIEVEKDVEKDVENGALPQLQCLRIRSCYSLEKLPEELKHISTLDKLELADMPERFVKKLEEEKVFSGRHLRIFDP